MLDKGLPKMSCIWHLTTAFMHKLEPKIPTFSFLAFFRKKEKIRGIELSDTRNQDTELLDNQKQKLVTLQFQLRATN